jgi:maltokinase
LRTYEKPRHRVKHVTDVSSIEKGVRGLDLGALGSRRWFAGKARRPIAATFVDALDVPGSDGGALVLVDVTYVEGEPERYVLPSRLLGDELVEASADDSLWPALARLVAREQVLGGAEGAFATVAGSLDAGHVGGGRALSDDQSNTSIVLGEREVVKCYRRLLPGVHQEPELLAALTRVGSRRAPLFGGALLRRSRDGEETLVCVYAYVQGEPVGWERLVTRLRDALSSGDVDALDALAAGAGALGEAAAELHADLARALGAGLASAGEATRALEEARAQLERARAVATGDLSGALAATGAGLDLALDDLVLLEGSPVSRTHGDLHVAQFVDATGGLVAVDFEGQPGRPLEARRQRDTSLRDLACLLLSLDHVAVAAARRLGFGTALDAGLRWSAEARAAATSAYRSGIAGTELAFDERLLRALEVEKECHEVIYAATVLPEWSYAPALVLPRLVGDLA